MLRCFFSFVNSLWTAFSIQRSLWPMILLKLFSVVRNALATHRLTILPSCHLVTLPVFILTPEFGLSMMLVETKHFLKVPGRPSRFTVNISSSPSRTLAAADGVDASDDVSPASKVADEFYARTFSIYVIFSGFIVLVMTVVYSRLVLIMSGAKYVGSPFVVWLILLSLVFIGSTCLFFGLSAFYFSLPRLGLTGSLKPAAELSILILYPLLAIMLRIVRLNEVKAILPSKRNDVQLEDVKIDAEVL